MVGEGRSVDRESFRSGVKLLALARWTLTCVGRDSRCWWVPGSVWIGSDPDLIVIAFRISLFEHVDGPLLVVHCQVAEQQCGWRNGLCC